ncbi:MAG TPA: hypothetical protein VMT10_12970 [Solirubrobacteraceae bacterium]|nr:hypothetical protein [Solirubrobacteraceae bacterium]
MSTHETNTRPDEERGFLLRFVRLWLPIIIIVGGLLVGIIGGTVEAWEGAGLIISAGLSVWLLNILFRVGVRGDSDRSREEAAREHYERTGHWPEDDA